MGDQVVALLLTLLFLSSWSLVLAATRFPWEAAGEGWEWELEDHEAPRGGAGDSRGLFILGRPKKVAKTDGGELRVVCGYRWRGDPSPMHIGFINMEPNTLFVPQYMDANIVLFVLGGELKIAYIYKDHLVERHLRTGDINVIPAGSTFYIVNTGKSQRLQIICSIDTPETYGYISGSYYIGGGRYPTSVISGFGPRTLTTAFNITAEELRTITGSQTAGPIVFLNNETADHPHHRLASLVQAKLSSIEKDGRDYDMGSDDGGEDQQQRGTSTWRKFFGSLLGKVDRRRGRKGGEPVSSPHPYNLYDTKPNYENSYGWSTAIDEHDYSPLKRSDVGVYLVNLTAGAMLAPHVNPSATEYGVILRGSGRIQVVFPNGSAAMEADVAEGDVFWIPRYYPFCQIASHGGPLEFFGFTTSARRNRPQFLVGASSVLRSMRGPELAAAFGVSEEHLDRIVKAQREAVIIPSGLQPEREGKKERKWEEVLLMKRGFLA